MAKYIGKKAINELRRRGVNIPKAESYEKIVEKLKVAERNIRNNDSDILKLTRSSVFTSLINAKTKTTKREALKYITELHDEHRLNIKQIVMALNYIEYNTETKNVKKQKEVSDVLLRRVNKIVSSKTKFNNIENLPTAKGQTGVANKAGNRLRGAAASNVAIFMPRLEKSMRYYPNWLKELILGQLELKGNSWLSMRLNAGDALPSYNNVLSSDRGIIEGSGLFDIYDFFKLESNNTVADDYEFKTINLTGKEYNELLKEKVI